MKIVMSDRRRQSLSPAVITLTNLCVIDLNFTDRQAGCFHNCELPSSTTRIQECNFMYRILYEDCLYLYCRYTCDSITLLVFI